MNRFYTRILPILVLVMILFAVGYAFADTNSVEESGAGDGQNAISGYTISGIRYTLNAATPTTIDSVQFDVAPTAGAGAPTTVRVQLNGAGSWFACSLVAGTTWSCNLTGVTVLGSTQLRIVAAQ
jgi:hypothetical protein